MTTERYETTGRGAVNLSGRLWNRYHSSVMDVENLDAGQEFSELPSDE